MNTAAAIMSGAYATSSVPLGTLLSLISIILIPVLVVLVIVWAACWKIYVKAGQPGWAAIVPFYNYIVLLRIVGLKEWWFLVIIGVALIPAVGGLFAGIFNIYVAYRLALCFGKGVGFTVGLIFLPFIFYPILGFGSAQYLGSEAANGTRVNATSQ